MIAFQMFANGNSMIWYILYSMERVLLNWIMYGFEKTFTPHVFEFLLQNYCLSFFQRIMSFCKLLIRLSFVSVTGKHH